MKKSLTPDTIAPPFARYSHGIKASSTGSIVATSGQLGLRKDGTIPATTREQADVCFANIDEILKSADMARDHIIRVNAYVTDRVHMAEYMQARDAYLAEVEVPPASTLMIVSGFTKPEFTVEIEVLAVA